MKKSRIIIPAIALIAFSVAASITGTVAWFTATRQASVDAGTYAVVKTTSNLKTHLDAGVGTQVTNTGNNDVDIDPKIVTVNGVLSDASVNHANAHVFTPNAAGTGLKDSPYNEIDLRSNDWSAFPGQSPTIETALNRGSTTISGQSKTIWTCVTWDITFTINFGAVAGDIGLYLDTNSQTNSAYDTRLTFASGDNAVTATGFRMAFIPKGTLPSGSTSAQTSRVYAGLQTSSNCHYLDSTTFTNEYTFAGGKDYTSPELINSQYHASLEFGSDNLATVTSRPDYLGTFGFQASQEVSLSYQVVCWFEGTDPNIVNQSNQAYYQAVTAYLAFKAVDLPSA